MKEKNNSRIDLTVAAVIVGISWFGAANISQCGRDEGNRSVVFHLDLDATVAPMENPWVVPTHKPRPTPIPQPVDEDLARTIARKE